MVKFDVASGAVSPFKYYYKLLLQVTFWMLNSRPPSSLNVSRLLLSLVSGDRRRLSHETSERSRRLKFRLSTKTIWVCYILRSPHQLWFPPSVMTDHLLPVLHVYHEISSWPNSWTSDPSWTILLEFGLINDLLLYVTGRRWCRSLAKVTKRVPIEKSKLFFVIPKTISVIPYPYNF